ncbi:MAG: hypothetical protein GX452_02790 [Ignavibacteriales bacterium]|jgi:NAD-dependent SIR2 family protein deacetylase|nr:hypothetical protein [Ignavibacteriaceae bacterium]NLH60314.1 hypothetical protein [Ignavibacteriales bacterium]HPO54549.1 hypothetical protein [Ignavibacteriaceae bacterium]
MPKTLTLTKLDEIQNVRLTCVKCNSATLITEKHKGDEFKECSSCGNRFHPDIFYFSYQLKEFIKNFKRWKRENTNGAEIWIESE